MKNYLLLALAVAGASPAFAQPDPIIEPTNGLPFPLITPAQAEKLTSVKPIKLRLDNVTVAWALELLQQQSGVEIDMENIQYSKNTLAKRLSIDIETPLFNRAFDEIMDEAGLKATLRNDDYNGRYRVNFNGRNNSDDSENSMLSSQGLFGVRLSRLNSTLSKTVDLRIFKTPNRARRDTLNAYISLAPDPRLPIIGTSRPRLTRADDDQGRSLLPSADETRRNNGRLNAYSFYSRNSSQTTLALLPPAPDAKKISRLEGVVVHSLVTKTETWEVPDLLGAPQWQRQFVSGDETFDMVIKAALNKGQPENRVTLTIEVNSSKRTESSEIPPPMLAANPIMAALKIRDAKGLELRNNSSSSTIASQGKLSFSATFYPQSNSYSESSKPLAMPLKMTFEAPLEVAQTEAPFAFEDVLLP